MAAPPPATAPRTGAYDPVAEGYDASMSGPLWDLYDHVTWATITPWLPPPGARVLDAGAGSGRHAVRFLERGDEVTLLDPSAAMLHVARGKVRARGWEDRSRFVQGGIERLDFADGVFDYVFCEGDPLSYCLRTHREAAGELLRVLRPGGAFYVSVDNRWIGALGFLLQNRAEEALAAAETGASLDPYGAAVHAFGAEELRGVLLGAGAAEVRVAGKVVLLQFLQPQTLQAVVADEHHRRRLFDLEARLALDPAMAGLAAHLHAVGRRGGA